MEPFTRPTNPLSSPRRWQRSVASPRALVLQCQWFTSMGTSSYEPRFEALGDRLLIYDRIQLSAACVFWETPGPPDATLD
jgi:hypothetical protein